MPNGRPPLPLEGKTAITTNITLSVDVVAKIEKLRKGAETRRDVIERIVREYERE